MLKISFHKPIVALHIFSVMAFLISCGNNKQKQNIQGQQQGPPIVKAYVIKKETALFYDQYPGTVSALNQVDLRAQVTGYITGIYFKDGERVKKGQLLYSIDQQQYKAAYDQAIANQNAAEANKNKAQQDADRYKELDKQEAIAKQILDHAVNDLQSAKMQVDASKAFVKTAENNLKYSVIEAPFDGTIGISQVKIGTLVTPGQTLLNSISSDDPLGVDFAADEKDIPRFIKLQQNQKPEIKKEDVADSTFRIQLPGKINYPSNGQIYTIDRAVDPQTGTIRVRIQFPNPDNLLKAGMSCIAKVLNGNAEQLLVPSKAVTEQLSEFSVYVIKNNKAEQRNIILGQQINDKVVVKKGLNAGDTIVMEGIQKVKNNMLVKVARDSVKEDILAKNKKSDQHAAP